MHGIVYCTDGKGSVYFSDPSLSSLTDTKGYFAYRNSAALLLLYVTSEALMTRGVNMKPGRQCALYFCLSVPRLLIVYCVETVRSGIPRSCTAVCQTVFTNMAI